MNWYWAYYDGGHSTREHQFENDEQAIAFILKEYNDVESIYNCGPEGESEEMIWLYPNGCDDL
jgi:hypothetical protein